MSVLIKGLEMPETEYMDVRIFQDGTATIATGKKPYYRELKAEPVRHGKWVPKYIRIGGQDWASGMKCSECGEDALNAEGNEFLTDYCPYCGARMDKDE